MTQDVTPERWRRISALLDEALEVPPEGQRELLEARCAGDAELLAQVLTLLAAGGKDGGPLSVPDARG